MILCANIIICLIKKKAFSKKILITTLAGGVIVFSIYLHRVYFFTYNNIDPEFVEQGPGPITSPTGEYTANAYYEFYGGAVGGVNVWVEITYNNEKNKVKTIYYADAKSDFSIKWLDKNTLYVLNNEPDYPQWNASIKLKVEKEIYHENGWACKSWLMKDEYETCYQS